MNKKVEQSNIPAAPARETAKADVREAVIQEARRQFARFGFRKASVDEIARGLRRGKSSLYYYFRSKEEIVQAVLEHEAVLFRTEIARAVSSARSVQKKLEVYVGTRLRLFRDLVNFYQAFRDNYLDDYPFIEKLRSAYDVEETAFLKGLLREGVEKGQFRLKDPETTAAVLVTALKGLEFRWASVQDEQELERTVRDMLQVLFHGILRR
jgi:AcrR family transcriptional regulator